MTWNDKWGDPQDYNIDPDREELGGLRIGDRVVCVQDDDDNFIMEGDEGVVIGISHTGPGVFHLESRDELCVLWDGGDPSCCNPDVVEQL